MRARLMLVVLVSLAACNRGSELDATDSTSTTMAAGDMTTTDGVATTYTDGGACMSTADCEDGTYCAAAYDPATATRGPAACVATCVPSDDLSRWCLDDLACCEGLRCNTVDGFCHPIAGDETTSGVTTDDSTSDGDSDETQGGDSTSTGSEDSTTGDPDDTTGKDDTTTGEEDSTTGSDSSSSSSEGNGD